ncbi:response regulator receiver protein [Candidatus Koribacter versatilis Ellin345]|uniref:Response regulator receiver protein n=1 Tax=Koribacter versatilis (strain Ellin345) TaxID=204669 RepID=Q1IKH9_KORVE|nr:response regulator [Candidatus Koribacter versatilis]ABF42621.1 response regulator receiver protein [Candidatus Koribacter versatilis Ellin345]
MSAGNYIFLPPTDALRWFKVLAVFRLSAAQGQTPEFDLPADSLPLRRTPPHEAALILMVDDQPLLREAVCEFLALDGYDVHGANSAGEAIRLLQEGLRPDLLLCDVLLPDVHGATLAREACALVPEMQVLFMSGHTPDILGSEIAPANFLQKPFRLDVLSRRLCSMLFDEMP